MPTLKEIEEAVRDELIVANPDGETGATRKLDAFTDGLIAFMLKDGDGHIVKPTVRVAKTKPKSLSDVDVTIMASCKLNAPIMGRDVWLDLFIAKLAEPMRGGFEDLEDAWVVCFLNGNRRFVANEPNARQLHNVYHAITTEFLEQAKIILSYGSKE